MANTRNKFDYVKSYDTEDKLLQHTWIVLRIDGRHFHQFSEENEFEKPNDLRALKLMDACAVATLDEFSDIVFAYGHSDEYSFVFKRTSEFYQRRASKIQTIIVSFFAANYIRKWKEFFPERDLRSITPSFDGRTVCYPSKVDLLNYMAWRQTECHTNNQYNTCFWMLVKSGKTEEEAHDILKGTQTEHKNELLFQQFGINYTTLPAIFRKGSCVFREKVEEMVKSIGTEDPVEKSKPKLLVEHYDINKQRFWREHPWIIDDEF